MSVTGMRLALVAQGVFDRGFHGSGDIPPLDNMPSGSCTSCEEVTKCNVLPIRGSTQKGTCKLWWAHLLPMDVNKAVREALHVVGLVVLVTLLALLWSQIFALLSHECLAREERGEVT